MKNFKGEGFNLKNFTLVYFSHDDLDAFITGGSGPKQSYSVANGRARLTPMADDTFNMLVERDVIAFNTHYWNGNYFGAKVFQSMHDQEQRVGAVFVSSNRCEYDKITWKVANRVQPPRGYPSWRAYAKARRASCP